MSSRICSGVIDFGSVVFASGVAAAMLGFVVPTLEADPVEVIF
jgi:hypothetical protein